MKNKSILFGTKLPSTKPNDMPVIAAEILRAIDQSSLDFRSRMKLKKLCNAYILHKGISEDYEPGTGHLAGPIKGMQKVIKVRISHNNDLILGGKRRVCGPVFKTRDDRDASQNFIDEKNREGLYRTTLQQWNRQLQRQDGNRIWVGSIDADPRMAIMSTGNRFLREFYLALDTNKEQMALTTLAEYIHNINHPTDTL